MLNAGSIVRGNIHRDRQQEGDFDTLCAASRQNNGLYKREIPFNERKIMMKVRQIFGELLELLILIIEE